MEKYLCEVTITKLIPSLSEINDMVKFKDRIDIPEEVLTTKHKLIYMDVKQKSERKRKLR